MVLKNFSFFLTILCSSISFSSYADEIDRSYNLSIRAKKQGTGLFLNFPDDFPDELVSYIFTFLEIPELLKTAQVSHMFNRVSSDDIVWKRHIKDFDKYTLSPYKKHVREEKENPVFFYIKNTLNGCVVDFPYFYNKQKHSLTFRVEKGDTYKIRRNDIIKDNKPEGEIRSSSLYFSEDGSSKNSKSFLPIQSQVPPPFSYEIIDAGLYLGRD